MPNKVASPKLSRRKLLINVSASGVAIAAGITIFDLRPWLDYEGQAKGIRKSLILDPQNEQQMHELVRYATLAANSHNSQPWKFKVKPNVIEIHPDYSRKLPVVDPDDRELWMSLGCALENLLIAARSQGFRCEVIYPDTSDVISVSLESDGVDTSPLLKSILSRQNNRSGYDGKEIPAKDLDHLQSVKLEPGVGLTWVLDADQL